MIDKGDLSYCCAGCGPLYTEACGVISPHFALCPRCGRFNEPAADLGESVAPVITSTKAALHMHLFELQEGDVVIVTPPEPDHLLLDALAAAAAALDGLTVDQATDAGRVATAAWWIKGLDERGFILVADPRWKGSRP